MARSSVWLLALVAPLGVSAEAYATRGDPTEEVRPDTPLRGPSRPEPASPDLRDVDLFDRVAIARAAGWIIDPRPTPDDPEAAMEARLEEELDDQIMRDRIRAGDVGGWHHENGRAMLREFRPDPRAIARERQEGMNEFQRVVFFMRRYARGPERPQDVAGQPLPEMRQHESTDLTDRRWAMEQELFDFMNPLNGAVSWLSVDVRVTHDPEGELLASWVLRSSGVRALDRAALEAARTGGVSRPEPPDEVVGERQAIRSDWRFWFGDVATLIGSITPAGSPTALLSCVDAPEAYGDDPTCSADGYGIVRTRIDLLRVVDATHLTPAERRAQRESDADRASP